MHFGFSYVGLIFLAMLMLPNIIWTKNQPKDYEKYFGDHAVELLRRFPGTLIDCYYEMDEGSVLFLEAKIKRLLEEHTI